MLREKRENCPTPQWVREKYYILDKENWTLNNKKINIPYPPEAPLSGYPGQAPENMEYETKFILPKGFLSDEDTVILHFQGVDQTAKIYLNDTYIGENEGGYLSFSFDVTDRILRNEKNALRVHAVDTLSHKYPYGKQKKNPGGMWYTKVSGIWKSVYLEAVPKSYIVSGKITPDLEGVRISLLLSDKKDGKLKDDEKITIRINGGKEQIFDTTDFYIKIDEKRLWSPEDPYLYDILISYKKDTVLSYFGLRKIEIKKIRGINRLLLNGKCIFLNGVLDQGYFKDGIYVPADKMAYDKDILSMKALGFNLIRKHLKIEPPYFYYACDKIGMLVMQDMVNSGPYDYLSETIIPNLTFKYRPDYFLTHIDRGRKEFFIKHSLKTLDELYNSPSVVLYTIFNEGWGQFESDRIYDLLKKKDDTRLYDSTSGWFRQKRSDFDSEHIYFHNERLTPRERPMLLSECGGYSLYLKDNSEKKKIYGYGAVKDKDELTKKIRKMFIEMVYPAIPEGLCGVIYTQLSDVEEEINGLYTYDRKVLKVDRKEINNILKKTNDILMVHV